MAVLRCIWRFKFVRMIASACRTPSANVAVCDTEEERHESLHAFREGVKKDVQRTMHHAMQSCPEPTHSTAVSDTSAAPAFDASANATFRSLKFNAVKDATASGNGDNMAVASVPCTSGVVSAIEVGMSSE